MKLTHWAVDLIDYSTDRNLIGSIVDIPGTDHTVYRNLITSKASVGKQSH
jgi:hypothetical protein